MKLRSFIIASALLIGSASAWAQCVDIFNDCGADGCAEPLVIQLDDGRSDLTSVDEGVLFDINAKGRPRRIAWTARGDQAMAFLALDVNGNGTIDDGSELFGTATRLRSGGVARNGFEALAQYDANGDGAIDRNDPIWSSLLIWVDENHDGVSQTGELRPVSAVGITRIALDRHWTGRRDRFGNGYGFESLLQFGRLARPVYDVYFADSAAPQH